jgi:hypothetical protein
MTVYSWNIACHLRSRPSDSSSELISDPAVVTPNRACLHLVAQGVFSATVSCIDIPVSPPAAISLARLDNSGYETRITPPCIFPSRLSPTDHCALFLLSLMPLHSSRTSLRALVASALDSERYLFRSTRTGGSNLRYFGCHRNLVVVSFLRSPYLSRYSQGFGPEIYVSRGWTHERIWFARRG